MTPADLPGLALALVGGALLGLFYFGGLWWTVQRLAQSGSPGLLTLGSFFIRTLVTLAGFYLLADGQWQRLLACLAGFIAARFALVSRWRPPARPQPQPEPPEAGGQP